VYDNLQWTVSTVLLCVLTADDHSRVVLSITEGSLESDYINASYIDVCSQFTDDFVHFEFSEGHRFVHGLL